MAGMSHRPSSRWRSRCRSSAPARPACPGRMQTLEQLLLLRRRQVEAGAVAAGEARALTFISSPSIRAVQAADEDHEIAPFAAARAWPPPFGSVGSRTVAGCRARRAGSPRRDRIFAPPRSSGSCPTGSMARRHAPFVDHQLVADPDAVAILAGEAEAKRAALRRVTSVPLQRDRGLALLPRHSKLALALVSHASRPARPRDRG
jgi:hypothetical protein